MNSVYLYTITITEVLIHYFDSKNCNNSDHKKEQKDNQRAVVEGVVENSHWNNHNFPDLMGTTEPESFADSWE